MAISRRSNPATYSPIQTYVQLPVDYLASNLAQNQQNYDINKSAEASFIEQLAKVKGREEDLPALRNISSAYENALNGIAEKVNRDYGSSNYKSELQKLAGNLRTDLAQGDLSVINSNYNTYQAYQKQVQEAKNYDPLLDSEYTNIAVDRQTGKSFYTGYKNSNGGYNVSKLGSINEGINAFEEADKVVKGINSISFDTPRMVKDANGNLTLPKDQYGNDIIINDKGEQISESKIRNTFREGFKNTPAYKQMWEKANRKAKIAEKRGEDFDPQAEVIKQTTELENSLVSKYFLNKSARSIDFHNIPEYQQAQNTTPTYTPTRNGAALTNPNVVGEISNAANTSDPEFLRFISQESQAQGRRQRSVDELYKAYYGTSAPPVKVDQIKPQLDRINKISDTKFTKDEYIQSFNKAIKDNRNVTLPGVQIQPKQAENYQQLLNNSKASALYNIGGEQFTINQLAEKYSVKPEEIEVTPSLIHYDSVDPNQKGGNMEVTLHIKGKEYIPALTALNDNFTAETALISEIGQNSIYRGQDTYTENNPLYDPQRNSDIYTITVPKKQYSAGKELPFETTVVIAPRSGDKPIKVSYSEFKEIYGSQAIQKLQGVINSSQTIAPKDLK